MISDIIIPETCPMLGIKLEFGFDKQGGNFNSPSLDRIIPELGYTKGNVMVISKRANMIKTMVFPVLDSSVLMTLLFGMLGLGTLRTTEKLKDIK